VLKNRNFNGVEVFRASDAHEEIVYNRIKDSVFQNFKPGTYTDKAVIVEIVNLMYKQYYKILDEYLPKVSPHNLVTFLASEYERYGKVSDNHKRKELPEKDDEFWLSYAIHARRGIKHIFELLCRSKLDASKVGSTLDEQEDAISMIFIAAEELVSLYMRSENYKSFLDQVTLTLDPNEHTYFNVKEDSSVKFDIRKSIMDFDKYVPTPMFLQDMKAHGEILDESFIETLGVSYNDTLGTLQWIIDTYSDKENPESLGTFKWHEAASTMTDAFKISLEQAEKILEGFCLSHETMQERELYKPKQEYRAYKRAFFKDQYEGVDLVFFSRRMAQECLTLLISDVPFRKLPTEWQSKSVKTALDILSLKAGRWFESVVIQNLETLGITGSSSVKALNLSATENLRIPAEIGEIDFLGFHEKQKLLVIIEIKQVGFATEPRMFLDDLSKFIIGANSYSTKFKKKYNWAIENIESIEKHFSHKFKLDTNLNSAGYAMITLYPTIVSTKMYDFTCISLTDFMTESHESQAWSFSKTPLNRP
jgi:hypothetical protein